MVDGNLFFLKILTDKPHNSIHSDYKGQDVRFVICCVVLSHWSCNEQKGSVLCGCIVDQWHCLVAVETAVNLYAIKLVPVEFN